MKNILLLLSLSLACIPFAQDLDLVGNKYEHQNQYWLKTKVVLPVNGRLDLSAQYIGRISLGNEYRQGHYMYLSGKYKIRKWLQTDMTTRFVIDHGRNLYRLEAGLKVKHDIGNFRGSFRTAGFRENRTYLNTRILSRAPVTYWRNRAEITWTPAKKVALSNSFETWILHNNKHRFKMNKACYIAELTYDLSKRHRFSLAYQNQFDIRKAHRTALNMYCVGYIYTFRKLNK